MQWFRKAAIGTITLTTLISLGLAAGIIHMCTNSSHSKSIEADPFYNSTYGIYIFIVIIQLGMLPCCILSCCIAYLNWKNNYQMDHAQRKRFITWISLWSILTLMNLGMAVFIVIRAKEPQEELAILYEIFGKYNQDSKFVAHFERYQRENSCCGIYGPDDWLMVQIRSGSGSGGGGGGAPGGSGFQSLDYGFRQNPSTGNCHLTPPTIPMGCGKKLLEEIHSFLDMIAGIMILETVAALVAGGFAGYCFFYWLEKEVIVIPEDEVSNLIIIEPESSTSTVYSQGGYLPQPVYLPQPYPLEEAYYPPPPPYPYGSRSRGPSYIGSYHPSIAPRRTGYYEPPPHHYSGPPPPAGSNYQPGPNQPFSVQTPHMASAAPSTSRGVPPPLPGEYGYSDPINNGTTALGPPLPQSQGGLPQPNNLAGPYDSYSRSRPKVKPRYDSSREIEREGIGHQSRHHRRANDYTNRNPNHRESYAPVPSHRSNNEPISSFNRSRYVDPVSSHRSKNIEALMGNRNWRRYPAESGHRSMNSEPMSSHRRREESNERQRSRSRPIDPLAERMEQRMNAEQSNIKSFNRMLHEQERALGGKIVGERHVDHNKDDGSTSNKTNGFRSVQGHHRGQSQDHTHHQHGHHSHERHHPTLAIVHNAKAPKPKKLLAINDLNDDDVRAERERD